MIFLTLGTQLPFDRLVKAVDQWCGENSTVEVFGQIAVEAGEGYIPKNFNWKSFVEPDEFNNAYEKASLVVAHAGMGSIISALMQAKPIIVMPRKANLGEHRNDHQLATAEKFKTRDGVYVADNVSQLGDLLSSMTGTSDIKMSSQVSPFADPSLIETLRAFIRD